MSLRSIWKSLRPKRSGGRADATEATVASAKPRDPLLFLGDSITELWNRDRPEVFAAHRFARRAVSGETSRQVLARLGPALAEGPVRGVHVLCGINDIGQNEGPVEDASIQDNIAAMLGRAQAAGVPVWIGSITPCEEGSWASSTRGPGSRR